MYPLLTLIPTDGSEPGQKAKIEGIDAIFSFEEGDPQSVLMSKEDLPPQTCRFKHVAVTHWKVVPPEFIRFDGENYKRVYDKTQTVYAMIEDLETRIDDRLIDLESEWKISGEFYCCAVTICGGDEITCIDVEFKEGHELLKDLDYYRLAMVDRHKFEITEDRAEPSWCNTQDDAEEIGLSAALEILESKHYDVTTFADFKDSHQELLDEEEAELKFKLQDLFRSEQERYTKAAEAIRDEETAKHPAAK